MLRHLTAGVFGWLFTRWLDRLIKDRPRRDRAFALMAVGAILLSGLPLVTRAAETLPDGVTVRVRSGLIESGWHVGRITRDRRLCSVVELERPTEHGYTSVALSVVDALQLGRTGAWTAINARRAIAAEPAHCLNAGSD